MDDLINVPLEGLNTYEVETVAYLQHCMSKADEKGMLARVIYDMIAFGKITPHEVGEILGVYNPDGIELDDDEEAADYTNTAETTEAPKETSEEGEPEASPEDSGRIVELSPESPSDNEKRSE